MAELVREIERALLNDTDHSLKNDDDVHNGLTRPKWTVDGESDGPDHTLDSDADTPWITP